MQEPYMTRHCGSIVFLDNKIVKVRMHAYAVNENHPFSKADIEAVYSNVKQTIDELPENEAIKDGTYPIISVEGKTFVVWLEKNAGPPMFMATIQPTNKCIRFGCCQVTPPIQEALHCPHCLTRYCSEECRAADAGRHYTNSLCMMGPNPHPYSPVQFIHKK